MDVRFGFFRQMTPNTTTFDQAKSAAAISAVLAEVKERTGNKSIFITHSQGGAVGWDVDVENVSAMIAIEPGGAPRVDSDQYKKLLDAKIPIIFYFGDYMENGPQDIMSSGFWSMIKADAVSFAEAYHAAGGDATVIDLPAIGITGNSHFMFQEMSHSAKRGRQYYRFLLQPAGNHACIARICPYPGGIRL